MYKMLLKLMLAIFFVGNIIYADGQTDVNKEIDSIKDKINTLELTKKYADKDINRQILELKQNLNNLKNKVNNQTIDKKLIEKDFENFNKNAASPPKCDRLKIPKKNI